MSEHVEMMAWAADAIDGFAELQKADQLSTPELIRIIRQSSDGMDGHELYLTVLLATAIQKLSQYA